MCKARDAFLALIALTHRDDCEDMVVNECIHAGGCYMPAGQGGDWGTHLHELSLYGIVGRGSTFDSMLSNWISAAARQAREALGDAA
jgi:hypothetical protein